MNLENYEKVLENRAKLSKPKGIHSYAHSVVKEVCDWLEVKEFPIWLGIAKRIGAGELKAKLEYIKSRGIKSPRYLMICTKK